jgi:hypothetical protein
VTYNFQTGSSEIKLLTEYESVTQEVLLSNAVLTALMSGRKYDVITQRQLFKRKQCAYFGFRNISVIKMQLCYRTQYGKVRPSDNANRRWLKQFQETGSLVAAIERVTSQMLEKTWREIEYRLDTLSDTKCMHIEVS